MAIQIQRITDVGASNPIVARLGIQTAELIRWTGLSEEQNDAIANTYVRTLTARLVRCQKVVDEITDKLNDDIDRINNNATTSPGSVEIPFVVGLDGLAETFLYEGKNYLRDLLSVLSAAYGCSLADASALADLKGTGESDVSRWAAAKFGEKDAFPHLLRSDQTWVTELVRKRNAVEHPGGLSGTLSIHNVRLDIQTQLLTPPVWQRASNPATIIQNDMLGYVENLLTLAEDILVDIVLRTRTFEQIDIYEIPDKARDPKAPIRLRVDLNKNLQEVLARATSDKRK